MKKLLTLACVMAMATVGASAQSPLRFGVKAGVNVSSISNMPDLPIDWNQDGTTYFEVEAKPYMNFHAGVYVQWQFSPKFTLQPELTFSRQGQYFKENTSLVGTSVQVKIWMKYDYINLPVVVKFYPIENLSIELGPQIGLVVNALEKVKIKAAGVSETAKSDVDSEFYNSFDFALTGGFGYKITGNLNVAARYNLGLSNLFDHLDDNYCNRVMQLSLGWTF